MSGTADHNNALPRATVSKQNIAPRSDDAPRSVAQPQSADRAHASGNGDAHARIVVGSRDPHLHPHMSERAGIDKHIDFSYIRHLCEVDRTIPLVDLTPQSFAEHRRAEWPLSDFGAAHEKFTNIYEAVRATGLPNIMSARIPVYNALNTVAWDKYLSGVDDQLLDMIRFGFPMGYIGPASPIDDINNHPSATQFV